MDDSLATYLSGCVLWEGGGQDKASLRIFQVLEIFFYLWESRRAEAPTGEQS